MGTGRHHIRFVYRDGPYRWEVRRRSLEHEGMVTLGWFVTARDAEDYVAEIEERQFVTELAGFRRR